MTINTINLDIMIIRKQHTIMVTQMGFLHNIWNVNDNYAINLRSEFLYIRIKYICIERIWFSLAKVSGSIGIKTSI